jgi:hypothetical protein
VRALVARVLRLASSVRVGCAGQPLGSIEGTRDPRAPPRALDLASAGAAPALHESDRVLLTALSRAVPRRDTASWWHVVGRKIERTELAEARRPATVPLSGARSRQQVQRPVRRCLPKRGHQGHTRADRGAERQRRCRALGADAPARVPRPDPYLSSAVGNSTMYSVSTAAITTPTDRTEHSPYSRPMRARPSRHSRQPNQDESNGASCSAASSMSTNLPRESKPTRNARVFEPNGLGRKRPAARRVLTRPICRGNVVDPADRAFGLQAG